MDIYKFINEKFDEERGKELIKKYSNYIKNDGCYKRNSKELRKIHNLITEINVIKRNN